MSPVLIALILVLILNYAVFLVAFKQQTDHYTDITYAFSFVLVAAYFYFVEQDFTIAKTFLFSMVALWGLRLGLFLRSRVGKMGEDKRFTNIRPSFWRFFRFFTIQGVAICLISLPFIIGFQKPLYVDGLQSLFFWIGGAMMVFGFCIEALADHQKNVFKSKDGNSDKFMKEGVFTYIRHPNYLGEIMFWIGIFFFVFPYMIGIEYASVVSPIFIIILLNFISGINLLEKSHKKKYGDSQAYQDYVERTWRLLPFIY